MASLSGSDTGPHHQRRIVDAAGPSAAATASGAGSVALALGICAGRRGGVASLSRSLRSWTALRTASASSSAASASAGVGASATTGMSAPSAASAALIGPAWTSGAGAAGSQLRRAAARFGGWRHALPPPPPASQPRRPLLPGGGASLGGAAASAAAAATRSGFGGAPDRARLGLGWLPARPRLMATAAQGGGAGGSAAAATAAAAAKSAGAAAAAAGGVASALAKRLASGRLGSALRLQVAAAWHSYGRLAYAGAAVLSVYLVWRLMYGVSNLFIELNNTLAEWGLLGLAVTVVVMAGLYLRWRTAINPAAVYRQAMVKLNTNAGVLEVMGAPLVGSEVRAYVVTGGGLYLSKSMRVKLRSRRIQMMFPLSGPERKGLVSLEAKRKSGRYEWRLLAVDLGPELQAALPAGGAHSLSAAPPPRQPPKEAAAAAEAARQQRVYIIGDVAAYDKSGVLGELRSPFLQALSNSRSYEVEDELEDELDELKLPPEHSRAGAAVQGLAAAAAGLQAKVAAAVGDAQSLLRKAAAPELAGAGAGAGGSGGSVGASASVSAQAEPQAAAAAGKAAAAQGVKEAADKTEKQAAAAAAAEGQSWWSKVRAVVSGPGSSAK